MTHRLPRHETVSLTTRVIKPVLPGRDRECGISRRFQKHVNRGFEKPCLEAQLPTCLIDQFVRFRSVIRLDEPEELDKQLESFVVQ